MSRKIADYLTSIENYLLSPDFRDDLYVVISGLAIGWACISGYVE